MRADGALRLLALPLCGALVGAVIMPLLKGPEFMYGFSGFLYGFILSMFIGLPLLLLGDRFWAGFKGRHIASGLLQGMLVYLVYGGFGLRHLVTAIVGGLVLGLLYAWIIKRIEQFAASGPGPQRGKGYLLGLPLCGGLPIAVAALYAFDASANESPVAIFFFVFFIGAGLSMLLGWPLLWLIERFFTGRFRYIIGGLWTGFLIWLLFGAPGLAPGLASEKSAAYGYILITRLGLFLACGLASGLLFTGFNWACEHLQARRTNKQH